MNLHFCTDMDGWVLQRSAELIAQHLPGATVGEHLRRDAANVYFPYYRLQTKGPTLDIALFTHFERGEHETSENKRRLWKQAAVLADRCVAMSQKGLEHLPEGSSVIGLPADPAFCRVPVFGVVGREYMSGRKRTDWTDGLPGKWIFSNGAVPWEQMPEFYRACDYIVIVSDNEGGPMPVKEALASGKPVIAPDVGWAWEYPVIRYEGADGLRETILSLMPKDETRDIARAYNSLVHYLAQEVA